jgi:hypothetical protein
MAINYGIVITIGIFTRTKVAWTNPSTSVRVLLNPSVTRRSIYSLFEVLVLAGSSVLKSTSTCGYCPTKLLQRGYVRVCSILLYTRRTHTRVRIRVYVVE